MKKQKEIRKLTKVSGSSYAVVLPIEYIRKLKWRAKQKLEVRLDGDKIVIKDWNPEKK